MNFLYNALICIIDNYDYALNREVISLFEKDQPAYIYLEKN